MAYGSTQRSVNSPLSPAVRAVTPTTPSSSPGFGSTASISINMAKWALSRLCSASSKCLWSLNLPLLGAPMRTATVPSSEETEVLPSRSEEHTSELQSRGHLVCRLLLEKKKCEQKKQETSNRQ